jgi:hypothetical protein
MSNARIVKKSMSGGEVTPEFWGQSDDAKYVTGLATCLNFIPLPHGPVANRAGFAYVATVKTSAKATRLIPFVYSTTQTMVLEVGEFYIRFHTQGATLLVGSPAAWSAVTNYAIGDMVSSGGTNYYCILAHVNVAPPNGTRWYPIPSAVYEIPTPYAAADLFDLNFVQSSDVLTIVHPNYPPSELRRLSATKWTLIPISFVADIAAPTGVSATPAVGAATVTYRYVVTAIANEGGDQSLASTAAACLNNLLTTGATNTIAWSAVSGARRYNVYKQDNGLYGYIGQTDALTFVDNNITADISTTPPELFNPFSGSGNYPGSVTYFEQRRVFAGTTNKPQNIWLTRSGTESNMSFSIPTRDDDAIAFRVAAREANTIRHMIPLANLVLLTSAAEWRVTSINSDALTPTTFDVKPQSYVGANMAAPVVVVNNLIYVAARGGHVRELAFSQEGGGYASGDVSLRATHLFDTYTIRELAFSKAPYPIVWARSSTGNLLSFTYVPEQQVGAWAQHNTDGGTFESCCVVGEGDEDVLYVITRRTVNSSVVQFVERQRTRLWTNQSDAFFVDAGSTYDGAPVTTISGLTWLEGETVSILADGAVHPQRVVTSGAITLDHAASKVQVGLPITADLQTLPIAFEVEASGQGRPKNINEVWLRVFKSSGIFAGPSFDKLTQYKQRTTEVYGAPPALMTGEIPLRVESSWNNGGHLCVRQSDPLPLTVSSITIEFAIGG